MFREDLGVLGDRKDLSLPSYQEFSLPFVLFLLAIQGNQEDHMVQGLP